MYVRKKKNRLGTISVVVVSKSSGRYKEIKIFGTSFSSGEIDLLCNKVAGWINLYGGQQELDFENRKGCELNDTERFIKGIMCNSEYLKRFFRNLLLCETNELRNRYMVVNATKELTAGQVLRTDRTSTRTTYRTSTRTSSCFVVGFVKRKIIVKSIDGESQPALYMGSFPSQSVLDCKGIVFIA